ncbi:MAG: 50S ribosomal protein L17 [Candidatus Kerfeldbacteria bacterium]|nr:50S ribosomal protein L17 [Candidatus Kerfeldbacteria bacterium]
MRHRHSVKSLNRNKAGRLALSRSQLISLIMHQSITTTVTKAKILRSQIERLITTAKPNRLSDRRQLLQRLGGHSKATMVLLTELGPKYSSRSGGYTRIIRLPKKRAGDNATIARLEFID